MEKEAILKINNINKKYNNKIVLEDINFEVYKGEFLSILGPSDCGKTTLLRLLIGIDAPNNEKIFKNDEDVTFKNLKIEILELFFKIINYFLICQFIKISLML